MYLRFSFAALTLILATASAVAASPGPVRLEIVARPIADLKAVFATVESERETSARTRGAGTLTALAVREGDQVRRGQVIAVVRDPKLPLQRAALEAGLAALKAQAQQAEGDLARARRLESSGVGSRQQLDDAQAAAGVLRARIAAQEAERAAVEERIREGDVLAPTEGRVLRVEAIDGAVVMPGEVVATIAARERVLRLRLPERHARFLAAGDSILVGSHSLDPSSEGALGSDRLRRGTITLVYPELTDGRVVADAQVPGIGDFFIGERVRVHVATGVREAVVIPPDFLTRRFGADFLRLAGGAEVPVQAGGMVPAIGDQPGGIEILTGVRSGDVVIRPEPHP